MLRPARLAVWKLSVVATLTLVLTLFGTTLTSSAYAANTEWDPVFEQVQAKIEQVPQQYADGDQDGVEASIRQAYYEVYQVSGLESQIDHRLGEERDDAFVEQLLTLRQLTRDGASQSEVDAAVATVITTLETDAKDLADAPELNDQWSRVATRAVDALETAKTKYAAQDYPGAANAARDAYLAHYEADGLEKASISYLGQSLVGERESLFTELRQQGRDGELSPAEYDQLADSLIASLEDDAAKLDQMTAGNDMGWAGFWAAFLILLREGAEALLVVAALVTYAKKAGRRDQLVGILLGVVAALVAAVALAFGFSKLTASAAMGLGQELVEGITGLLAVVMLVIVANWILSKAVGNRWDEYIKKQTTKQVTGGGTFALASVAFLAVFREGAETILFFSPILAASKTSGDMLRVWFGVGAAALVLAVLFLLVWLFGIRLPLRAFFRWTSILLGILAVTIAGGAIKEFQDATLVPVTTIEGVPTIPVLGLYPTVQTLAAQAIVILILLLMAVLQLRRGSSQQPAETAGKAEPKEIKN